MKRTFALLSALLFAACLLGGCGKLLAPTYPKNEIPSAIQKICREEYGITEKVDVKIVGKTLGARIHLDELLDMNFKMQEKSLDKLQDLLRVIRRICLSTDAELDFYIIMGYEKKLGIEVIFYSYVDDLKRVVAGWMSPDDYFQRLIRTMQLNTLRWGNNRIEKLIKDIESGNAIKIIVNNFAPGVKLSELSPEFIKILTDLNKKSYIKWSLLKENSAACGSQERLYYIEAKEKYTPVTENTESFQYPSGTLHKFYILISIDDLQPEIVNIYGAGALPEKYSKFGNPLKWGNDDFYVEDFTFQNFLSTQIVQRIQSDLNENKKDAKNKKGIKDAEDTKDIKEPSYSFKGDFIIEDKIDSQVKLADPSKNIFKVIIDPKNSKKGKTSEIPQDVIDLTLKTIKTVCNTYKFYDMGEVQVVDNKGNSLLSVDKPTLFKKN